MKARSNQRNAKVVGLRPGQALADAVPDAPSVPQPVIPMGVDVEGFADGVGERAPVFGQFLFVGRLAEKKGVDVLLRALADVPEATLVVGGEGPDDSALRALSQDLGIGGRVRFVGRLSRDQLRCELRRAYAVVVPSLVATDGDQDTTPLVMSESMSAAVPVIASRLGGLAERIEPGVTGLLAEPGSPKALAKPCATRWRTRKRSSAAAATPRRGFVVVPSIEDHRGGVHADLPRSRSCPLRKSPIA